MHLTPLSVIHSMTLGDLSDPVSHISFLFFLLGKVSINSKQLKSSGVLVLFLQIPRPCLLLGSTPSAMVASIAKAIVGQPNQCLGSEEHRAKTWGVPKLDTSSCFGLVFIPWIRERTIYTIAPKERRWNLSAASGLPLFRNLSCVLRFQQSNWLLKITSWFEVFLCP